MHATNRGVGALSPVAMRRFSTLCVFFALACNGAVLRAQDHPARAELLADVAAIKPGEPFTVGILLSMDPGWHVYWINPGDAGQPPEVEWTLPDGFEVTDLRFPAPKRFEEAGGITGYGYESEVLLTATVTPSADVAPGQTHAIKADVNWLVCEAVCLPGEAQLSLDLPVAESAAPSNRALFESWRKRLPTSADDAGADVNVSTNPDLGELQIIVDWKDKPPAQAEWFAPPTEGVIFSGVRTETNGAFSTITVQFTTMVGKSLPEETLKSVLAYDRGDGVRRGLSVPIEFSPQNNRSRSSD